jgi:hypothetical protein
VRTKYNGNDQVHTASSSGMNITHIGHSVIPTPNHNLILKNILHVLQAAKNLLSVHRFTTYNHESLEYFPNFSLVKDLDTRRHLLKGCCHHGLYPLPPKIMRRHAFGVVKPSLARWHYHLGHPSSSIAHKVVSSNNLPCLGESISEAVCDACQRAKSHQLPYTTLSSISSVPLELIFSDVWGPVPSSVGSKQYYVSFIDDFSKFT